VPKNRKNKTHDQEFWDKLLTYITGGDMVAAFSLAVNLGMVSEVKELADRIDSFRGRIKFMGEV